MRYNIVWVPKDVLRNHDVPNLFVVIGYEVSFVVIGYEVVAGTSVG